MGIGTWLRDLGVVDEVVPATGLDPLVLPPELAGGGHLAVNLHGRGPQSHAVLAATRPSRLVAFAADGFPDGPVWRADEHEVDRWCRLVSWAGGECGREDLRLTLPPGGTDDDAGAVLLHPGASSGSRRWPPDRWSAVAAALASEGRRVLVTGGPDEVDLATGVVTDARSQLTGDSAPAAHLIETRAGTLTIPALADLVASAALLICGDTGVAHLATALGTPSVLLFGPTPPQQWGPAIDEQIHTVLWHGDPTNPGDPHADQIDTGLESISRAETLATALRQLSVAELRTPHPEFGPRPIRATSERADHARADA
ncbi:glycosyltransferase family 9 protein [Cellulomonas sp. SG140]|uniref:glycosyltransferase family 9 protein n=1 Tax=Cellulomonas sp. SG140 TaxID=2976536 RepID=UPI0021E77E7F|nr:glycosyltransferase family 9 protein [Cellulomonas sp. SG140]